MVLSADHPFRSAKAKEEYLALNALRAKEWPVPFETRMVETSYGPTFVRISGPPEAPPLVLLPGITVSSLMWALSVGVLSTGFRTYAVDTINDTGLSVCTRVPKTGDDFATWLDEVFTGLALGDKVHLLGMSLGGFLASQYAVRFPNRLAKTVLIAPGGGVLPVSLKFVLGGVLSAVGRWFHKRFMHWTLADALKNELGRRIVEMMLDDEQVAKRCFKTRGMVVPTLLTDEELKGLPATTLYLVGEHEKVYSATKALKRLNTVAPQIKTELIAGAGHDLLLAQTDLVHQKVLEFLQ